MSNKKLIIGIATGVALLAAAGLLLAKRNKSAKQRLSDEAGDLANTYKHKLSNLQKKAKRELNDVISHGTEISDRVNDLVKRASTNFQ